MKVDAGQTQPEMQVVFLSTRETLIETANLIKKMPAMKRTRCIDVVVQKINERILVALTRLVLHALPATPRLVHRPNISVDDFPFSQ
jgi:hypothetical protein